MNKIIKEIIDGLKAIGKGVVIVLLIGIVIGVGYNFWNAKTAISRTPSNPNIIIPQDVDFQSILPNDFGGNDYNEKFFIGSDNINNWLSLCYARAANDLKVDDIVRGLKKIYVREYRKFDGTNLAPYFCVQEYETEKATKEAASSLIIAGIGIKKIDGAEVIGRDDVFGTISYALVTGKYLITVSQYYYPMDKMIKEIVKLYGK